MRGKSFLLAIAWMPLWLAGCMLPQPDTPIIPPGVQAPMASERAGDAAPLATPAPQITKAEDALFAGAVVGAEASAIQATPEGASGQAVRQELGADGAFSLTLTPGTYRLELVVGGEVAVLEERLAVEAGQDRHVTLAVSRDPLKVTLEEAPPEAPASPEATATES